MAKVKQKTKGIRKFLLVLSILVAYGAFAIHSYGLSQGLSVTILTWTFFVFCTPIADAGFLVDFPIRLITGFKMLYSELVVWCVALSVNVSFFIFNESAYQRTDLLKLFHKIIITPWPLGFIILLSAVGTFVSILFDDSLFDTATSKNRLQAINRNKAKLYSMLALLVLTFILYIELLRITNTHIKLI